MNMNKTGIALALAAILLSGNAFADGRRGNDGPNTQSVPSDSVEVDDNYVNGGNNNKQWEDSANMQGSGNNHNNTDDNSNSLEVADSFNLDSDIDVDKSNNSTHDTDNSKNLDVADSFNLDTDIDVDKSNNSTHDTDNSKNLDVADSFNIDADGSTNDSYNQTYELDIDATFVVANSSLDGEVNDNEIEIGSSGGGYEQRGRSSRPSASGAVNLRAVNSVDGMRNVAGITSVAQNAGANSLVQQSVNTNASIIPE
ncbi:hypothetical protein VIN01S_23420 [Vibrio inusitatus NBRC 102082]|uniref:Dentin sialophosphoprotein n=1 Tax=Vibrio inusitatus NBRC 102082 TaxID=1219070 RepID=A0A4Y3HWZ5_9VIBR|nr:hypothetical protein [Vibrio inusitatus]GEA51538.1 hypothetical protein VIN01S_23420 [Vibrio inusitatus NBRC 102082]